ncbi:hypothetical protein [Actinospica robiniae]|uniref:hypothetical protein n=1 Tax=Actinospica robiniae TaxID=304901 RepID=UPI0005569102|nr:hypothetical protein [Actinospica robiniae]
MTYVSTLPTDTDSRAYAGSRSGETFDAVLAEFGIALPSGSSSVRYFVSTSQDTRDLYLTFVLAPSVAASFLRAYGSSTSNVEPGCSSLCGDVLGSDIVPWNLSDTQSGLEAVFPSVSASSDGPVTTKGDTMDVVLDERDPQKYTLYLHVIGTD